ncbi:BREX-1 system adenine-specific DNA-methyltransferase PglX [Variovorax sp. RTB1]|uniref:BREX-1 system adenine-specific DNA-methyltransferase PglX n=1 Tax=Variovorax sp. RTB1 TaxID=3048631 RepID=UPI002B2320E4|nr:BREX-1 system adenine-specific DNA-methyltransferase PglX [Variovorax sp. RTB1]MEB0112773.1 BREX-1 system adenine-specific DNA-methyltransferase PglX [Variovorax sp. RTB1]
MNKANLKSYAPKARLDFIKAVTERANVLGISAAGTVPAQLRGDVAIIDGREWPAKVAGQCDELVTRIKRHGFEQTMDEVAYTWFNRFAALRYMEIHDYLGHGWRVLSSRDGGLPEILRHASELTLPGLNADRAREMQLAGNQDNELYKLLLVAQCNELSRVMPFLFERIDDETELLLPENLLRTDSIVAKLVESVPEEDWQEIEVIGWLYQFYISEKKDQVIGKVVKSEDIPAATQLFTPNWIVQYLVQNSVGRLWLMANPTSTLASMWPYYIHPAEQTSEVQAQLDALIQARISEDGETLDPEAITVLDPACGSGHILVVAYDLLKAIYLERGYQPRAIPRLILEKNLYGLDIDDRAAQLAAFALLMKARADDRRLFDDPPKVNVLSLQESKGLELDELGRSLTPFGLSRPLLKMMLETFENAKTFGSLIEVPPALVGQLSEVTAGLQTALLNGDLYAQQAARDVLPLVRQTLVLSTRFDAVVANPPYMGGKNLPSFLKDWAEQHLGPGKADLFAMFILRSMGLAKDGLGISSLVTMQSWMFISTFEELRRQILEGATISSLVQVGFNSFPEMNSKIAQACAFSIFDSKLKAYHGSYVNLNSAAKNADKQQVFLDRKTDDDFVRHQESFSDVPGHPLAYWASDRVRSAWKGGVLIQTVSEPRKGLDTGENDRFLRRWHEVSFAEVTPLGPDRAVAHWVPIQKGGSYRRWYGNNEYVVDWRRNGEELRAHPGSSIRNEKYYGRAGATWSTLTSSDFSMRYSPEGFIFESKGAVCFPRSGFDINDLLAFGNTKVAQQFFGALSQTMDYHEGPFGLLPYIAPVDRSDVSRRAQAAVQIAKADWDSSEESWDFQGIVGAWDCAGSESVAGSWSRWEHLCTQRLSGLRKIEESNNQSFIEAYGLQDELSPAVLDTQITLVRAARDKDCQRLISNAIGCMMGRYSLDEPGLVYAHAGSARFDPSRYEKKFPADADGILPLTDERWFEDDAASRVREFVLAVWGAATLEENMTWVAESLGAKGSDAPDHTIRRYLTDKFFKDHLQAYKKRPIYWLFSSGKQGAFQALIYLHRYAEGTLARLRTGYVVPLIGKMVSRLEMLEEDLATASSAAARTKVQKKIELLKKKQIELLAYDEKVRHYADMRITLDLDDGVKVNYAKFGDLVAESKAITGGSDE